MRTAAIALAVLFPFLACAAVAAPKNPPPKATGPTVRYFDLYGSLVGEVETQAMLKETRQGASVTAAVLDVCYATTAISNRKERFVVDLAPVAGKFSGTAQTAIGKQPVSVQLLRKVVGKSITFEGTIKIGAVEHTVSSPDNTDVSEQQYRDAHRTDEIIFPSPMTFADLSPGTVGARVKVESLPELATFLRGENVRVRLDSLQPDCAAMRAGNIAVLIQTNPMRADALAKKVRALPIVTLAGWSGGNYGIENAVRLRRADFGGANFDRDKLAVALAASAAKTLSATVGTTTWDDMTGEVTIKLKRPAESFPGLGLTDMIELTLQAGPDKPGSGDTLAIWLGNTSIETNDDGAEPRMKLVQIPQGEGSPGGDYVDTNLVLDGIARDLKGQRWGTDAKNWK